VLNDKLQMNAGKRFLLLVFSFFLILSFRGHLAFAQETEQEKLERLSQEIKRYEEEIKRLNSQAQTLSNQIAQYDAQIRLTTLKIEQTQEKIALLSGRIEQLEKSLSLLTKAYSLRVKESYMMNRVHEPFLMVILSPNLGEAFSSFYYLKRIQEADRDLLLRLGKAQVEYEGEKSSQEELEKDLGEQKKFLNSQKSAKSQLLQQTRNDEKRYQELLAAARSEFEAIQAIIAGKGEEIEVGRVDKGQRIASIIQGASCNSSGTHLHFIVKQGDTTRNPFEYLKPGIDFENCSGSSCGSGDGDPFNPSGSLDWPIYSKVKFSQGYGTTWAIRNTWVGKIYSFHNGIDIDSESRPDILAPEAGILFRGSYTGVKGCRLRYVRIAHNNLNLETLYLHVNY